MECWASILTLTFSTTRRAQDSTGNRTKNLPSCAAVPQPTVPQRAPVTVVYVIVPVKSSTACLFICYCVHIEYSPIIKLNLTFHCKVYIMVVPVYTCYRSQDILSFGHSFLAHLQLKPLKKTIFFVPSSITHFF
jgi:hypothetical protein